MTQDGLAQVFMAIRPALRRFIVARGVSPDEADDVLQDLFVKLDTHPTAPIAEPRSYLYRMADNLVLDRRRAAQRRVRREQQWTDIQAGQTAATDERPSPERALIARDQVAALMRSLGTLPERTLAVLTLFRVEGHSQKQIALQLGISLSAVEKHLQRAYRAVAAARAGLDAGNEASRRLADERGMTRTDD